jgi:hypothetical protein
MTIIQSANKHTPEIVFNPLDRKMSFTGISAPVNAQQLYQSVIDWMTENESTLQGRMSFAFRLEYFNSASMKAILMLLRWIKSRMHNDGNDWQIEWLVEEDDDFMLDAADSYQQILEIPFLIVQA